ncbi:MAG: helical backbone metal receptor [Planctomycetota bacterium]
MFRAWIPIFCALCACSDATPREPSAEIRRVVSLLPSFTEIVVALQRADTLVGCTEAGRPGRSDVARLPWRPPIESVIRLSPDVVLRQKGRAENDALRTQLEAAGVRVVAIPSETIADVQRAITEIGELLDASEKAGEINARFDRDLEAVRASVAGKRRPCVLFVFGRDQGAAANVRAAGPNTFLDELVTLAGGRNVLADLDQPYPDVSLADLVRRKPEVIIDNLPAEKNIAAVRAAWSRLKPVPAVRDGKIHAVFDRDLLIPGPRLPAGLARLAKMIHGED